MIDVFLLWLTVLTKSFLWFALAVGGVHMAARLVFCRALAERRIQPKEVSNKQLRRELGSCLNTVLVFSAAGLIVAIGRDVGLFRIYTEIGAYGALYLPASFVLALLAHDTFFYWAHRAMHRPRLFRLFHRGHHRSRTPNALTAYSMDGQEAAVHAAFVPLFLLVVPMHELAILAIFVFLSLRNAIGHCGFELFPAATLDHPILKWSTTVTHHDLHHRYNRSNFGLYFTWWDRLMGTEDAAYAETFRRVTDAEGRAIQRAYPGGGHGLRPDAGWAL